MKQISKHHTEKAARPNELKFGMHALEALINMSFKCQTYKVYSLGDQNFPKNCPFQVAVFHGDGPIKIQPWLLLHNDLKSS